MLLEETVASLQREHPEIDFDTDIQKVFAVEVYAVLFSVSQEETFGEPWRSSLSSGEADTLVPASTSRSAP